MVQSRRHAGTLRIGTRGSPLALAQAHLVQAQLAGALGIAAEAIEIRTFRTTGDRIQDRPLSEAGGKGLFTKEIEEALLSNEIDLAVHSCKDMPTLLPDGLVLAAFPEREDVRDVFISHKARHPRELPAGAVVGTASLRRQAMMKQLRPDLEVINFRGNVQTRLRKLEEGTVDATLLALAGLNRLGLTEVATTILPIEEFLPAVGQGAIAIETRTDDAPTRDAVGRLNHADTHDAVLAERAFLAMLEGSCRTPIGGHAVLRGDTLHFRGLIVRPDGRDAHATERTGPRADAERLGADAGAELRGRGGPGFFGVG
jgi:hydroxymethylbilane synthase